MTKQVQLSDEAYERLKRAKRPGDSFSDVVVRAFGRPSLLAAMKRLPRLTEAEYETRLQDLRRMRDQDQASMDRLEAYRRTGKWP